MKSFLPLIFLVFVSAFITSACLQKKSTQSSTTQLSNWAFLSGSVEWDNKSYVFTYGYDDNRRWPLVIFPSDGHVPRLTPQGVNHGEKVIFTDSACAVLLDEKCNVTFSDNGWSAISNIEGENIVSIEKYVREVLEKSNILRHK